MNDAPLRRVAMAARASATRTGAERESDAISTSVFVAVSSSSVPSSRSRRRCAVARLASRLCTASVICWPSEGAPPGAGSDLYVSACATQLLIASPNAAWKVTWPVFASRTTILPSSSQRRTPPATASPPITSLGCVCTQAS